MEVVLANDRLGFNSTREYLDDEGMQTRKVGAYDGEVLGNLVAEYSSPVGVGEVGGEGVVVEKVQLS